MFHAKDIVMYRGDEVTLDTVKKMVQKPPGMQDEEDIKAIMRKRLRESCFPRIELFFEGSVKVEEHARKIIECLIAKDGIFRKQDEKAMHDQLRNWKFQKRIEDTKNDSNLQESGT